MYLHREMEADGFSESSTPSDIGLDDEMGRLEDVSRLELLDRKGRLTPSVPLYSSFRSGTRKETFLISIGWTA